MKKTLFFGGSVFATSSQACGSNSVNMLDVALTVSVILVVLCSIAIPLVTMLVVKMIDIKLVIEIAIGVLLASGFFLSLLMFDLPRAYRGWVIMLLACSLFLPTCFYCYKAIQQHVKSTSGKNG